MSRSSPPEPSQGPARWTAALLLGVAAILSFTWAGCSGPKPEPPPEHVYTVRGRIDSLPDGTKLGRGLQIQHEPIPDFVNNKGERKGMPAMVMAFEPAAGLDLSGFKVGDPVEFVWEVRWAEPSFYRITKMTRLPTDTELRFDAPH